MSTASTQWLVEPYVGVGPVRLGSSRGEVEEALGASTRLVGKGTKDEEVLAYEELGLHVYLEKGFGCAALEFWGRVVPVLQGQALLHELFSSLREWFATLDPAVQVTADGLTSFTFGVSLSAPAGKVPDAANDGAFVFRLGYYDS
jgi:hypothetical protein